MSMQSQSKIRAARCRRAAAMRALVRLSAGLAVLAFFVLVLAPHLLGIHFSPAHAASIIAGVVAFVPFAATTDSGHRSALGSLAMARAAIAEQLAATRLAVDKLVTNAAQSEQVSGRCPPPPPAATRSRRALAHICLAPRLTRRPLAACAHAG